MSKLQHNKKLQSNMCVCVCVFVLSIYKLGILFSNTNRCIHIYICTFLAYTCVIVDIKKTVLQCRLLYRYIIRSMLLLIIRTNMVVLSQVVLLAYTEQPNRE